MSVAKRVSDDRARFGSHRAHGAGASAFEQAYVSRFSITESLKVRNIVLFAPDIDIDVAATKIFDVFSDPDAPYGAKKNPNATIRQGSFHLTIYSSPGDQACPRAPSRGSTRCMRPRSNASARARRTGPMRSHGKWIATRSLARVGR